MTLLDTVVAKNTNLDHGAALSCGSVTGAVDIQITGGAVVANGGGGGVSLDAGDQLTSSGADWGSGPADNQPFDVDTGANTYAGFGAVASFVCSGGGICQ